MGLVVAVFSLGLMHAVVAFGNLTDYWTNFEFVKHVLSMDTLFPQTKVLYRALPQSWIHHLVYLLIILAELTVAVLFLTATASLYKNRSAALAGFSSAKKYAYWGVAAGMALWLIAFTVVGGEWFSMWQSSTWNALTTARSLVIILLLFYIALLIVE
jgi:predicted small integral membrane protein